MKQSVEGVKSLTDLLDEHDDLGVLIDKFNQALGGINGTASVSIVVGSVAVDLDQFEDDIVRKFIVTLKNDALKVEEGYASKITELTRLLAVD